MRKEFNPHRVFLVHQHDCHFVHGSVCAQWPPIPGSKTIYSRHTFRNDFQALLSDHDSVQAKVGIISLLLPLISRKGISLFQKYHNTLCCPFKFRISIAFNFSWGDLSPKLKLKTMLMQNF